ncbi:hypothetical protein M8494_16980 [Serratia ureilytica]
MRRRTTARLALLQFAEQYQRQSTGPKSETRRPPTARRGKKREPAKRPSDTPTAGFTGQLLR